MPHRTTWFAIAYLLSASALAKPPRIESRLGDGTWRSDAAIYPLKGEGVRLRVKPVEGATLRWYRIYPDLSRDYKNANYPWDPNPYAWIGWAKIDYRREELSRHRGEWELNPLDEAGRVVRDDGPTALQPHPTDARHYRADVGSFWFQVEIEKSGAVERSPGIDERDERGLSPSVFRMSIRDGDGYLGFLTSYLNVPGLFGSTPYQSGHYVGVDCADVLIAALERSHGRAPRRDYNVAMLVKELSTVARFTLAGGRPDAAVAFGSQVRLGDLIAVRYAGQRQFQHIGALHSDANADGRLDEGDLVLHAGPDSLHVSRLSEGGFDGEVVILRRAR